MSVLDAIPLEAISQRTRTVDVGRVLLTVLAAIFYGLGWIIGRMVFAVAWGGSAVRVGYSDGRRGVRDPGRGGG
ncbi:MAG: hypothetical protein HYR62_01945 [Actinobacteria bacterium]|nr:hypothetical protein [Actinomycetota bacterium]MBI3687245.1 hypothetical protein [Actinomycetota bacterium]